MLSANGRAVQDTDCPRSLLGGMHLSYKCAHRHALNVITLYLYLHLQTGRFRLFWDEAAKHRNIVEVVPGDNGL